MFRKNKIFKSLLCSSLAVLLLNSICMPSLAESADIKDKLISNTENSLVGDIVINLNKECNVNSVIEAEATVVNSGEYEFEMLYIAKSRENPIVSLQIDGEYPFAKADRIEFSNNWVNDDKIRKDKEGNELAPKQLLSEQSVEAVAIDPTGMYETPYRINLASGTHKIKITVFQGEFSLSAVAFKMPEEAVPYSDWLKQNSITETAAYAVIEAENAVIKNDKTLIPLSDKTNADISPCDPVNKKLNYIGGSNWSTVGDSITWEFDCKSSGYYYLGFMYRQSEVLNGVSYRHLRIDEKTPFEEAGRVKFRYNSDWQYSEYGENENPYLFYLEEGKHTLSLTVTAGELSSVYAGLKEIVVSLGELYIDITMIVGETVDNNRSYELFNQIPDFNTKLDENINSLNNLIETIENIQGEGTGSLTSNIISAVETLKQMRDNPYSAHRYKSAYYTAYTNLSATLGTLTDMPLDIDRIFIIGNGSKFEHTESSFFGDIAFGVKRFLNTFASEYNNTEKQNTESITIWVNWGRDQAQVLNALITEDFTPANDIDVEVKVANATLIQGILAGKGPDVMLQMQRNEPVNLAMRGALVDLSQFEDYGQIANRFGDGATVPYEYKNGVYALPDTQSFYVMFLRTDILEQFGLKIPKTWDEFFMAATKLQRNNLQVSLPYTQITNSTIVNIGVGGLTLYPTLLMQNNLSLYNEDFTGSTLTQPEQLKVFTQWTEWYTKYKVPTVMDFYNRFRIGSAPIGIAAYTMATQIKATAPEIEGNWTVAEIPGTVGEDGRINHLSAGSGTGCSITKLSPNPEAAWKFLKWWTSAEAQVSFSNNLESYIGPLGRVATSNIEAFDRMGWDAEFLPTLKEQQKNVKEIPEIPGGYYTARGIDQAFWNVVEQNKKPKDMLIEWGDIVNKEIERKNAEYSD